MNLITELPIWFLLLCLLLGVAYSAVLYYRERRTELPKTIRWIAAALRFLAITILAFLLLSPMIRINSSSVERPVIILVQDNSSSIRMNRDSAYYRSKYPDQIKELYEALSDDYEVKTYSFSDLTAEGLKTDFTGKQTDIAALFDDIAVRYANRNVGALILASDGIYNKGSNPLYSTEEMSFPIYTLALGDTNVQKDVILTQVNYNKVCYLGNSFPVEAVILANKYAGKTTQMTVSRGGQVLFNKTISIANDAYIETVSLMLEAHQPGIQHYRVALSALEGEISKVNNVQDIFVDVLDAKQKILILTGAPHPDVAAIRSSIEKNENYQVDVVTARDFTGNFDAYNLVILHQVPFKGGANLPQLETLVSSATPAVFILGSSSDLMRFNNLKLGLSVSQMQNKMDEAQAIINNGFALFTVSDELNSFAQDAPPLLCPFGEYKTTTSAVALFNQKIGKVGTTKPLIMFNQGAGDKTAVICGEGLWKWKLNNWLKKGNHLAFDELISKTIQYLAVKADKSFFRVSCKNRFQENEAVKFDAEIYNESYEMINDPEVRMVITDARGKKFNYTFNRTSAAYQLNAGIFPIGEYKYTATAKSGNKALQESGSFSVIPVVVESMQLTADHSLLNNIAVSHGGEMVYPAKMQEIADKIRNRDDIKSVSYDEKRFNDLISLFWVFLLIMALLSVEWFLRKRGGAY